MKHVHARGNPASLLDFILGDIENFLILDICGPVGFSTVPEFFILEMVYVSVRELSDKVLIKLNNFIFL